MPLMPATMPTVALTAASMGINMRGRNSYFSVVACTRGGATRGSYHNKDAAATRYEPCPGQLCPAVAYLQQLFPAAVDVSDEFVYVQVPGAHKYLQGRDPCIATRILAPRLQPI